MQFTILLTTLLVSSALAARKNPLINGIPGSWTYQVQHARLYIDSFNKCAKKGMAMKLVSEFTDWQNPRWECSGTTKLKPIERRDVGNEEGGEVLGISDEEVGQFVGTLARSLEVEGWEERDVEERDAEAEAVPEVEEDMGM